MTIFEKYKKQRNQKKFTKKFKKKSPRNPKTFTKIQKKKFSVDFFGEGEKLSL